MNKFKFLFGIFALFVFFGFNSNVKAQNGPVLYFCESYESSGERGIGDRFYTGPFTVMIKCDYELGLKDVSVQIDKYNGYGFDYFKAVKFDVKPSMKYIYFTDADLRVDSPGIYRVFLLDDNRKNIASGLVEFIR